MRVVEWIRKKMAVSEEAVRSQWRKILEVPI